MRKRPRDPWKISFGYDGGSYGVDCPRGVVVETGQLSEDDAHLVAAAPEMLKALKLASAMIRCQVPGNPAAEYCVCSGCSAADLARAAIAKAEGRV